MTPEEIHHNVVNGLIYVSQTTGHERFMSDWRPGKTVKEPNSVRRRRWYTRETSFIVWKSLWHDYEKVTACKRYQWVIDDLKLLSTQIVAWMYAMREADLYPIALSPGHQWMAGQEEFIMRFQSEADMVTGAALLV